MLLNTVPLGVINAFVMQACYAMFYGIGPMYASYIGLSVLQITFFMSAFIVEDFSRKHRLACYQIALIVVLLSPFVPQAEPQPFYLLSLRITPYSFISCSRLAPLFSALLARYGTHQRLPRERPDGWCHGRYHQNRWCR